MSASTAPKTMPMSAFAAAHGSTAPARRAARVHRGTAAGTPGRLRRALPPFVRALFG